MSVGKEQRRTELARMTKRDLARMCDEGITAPNGHKVPIWGKYPVATWDREEIIEAILDVEFYQGG